MASVRLRFSRSFTSLATFVALAAAAYATACGDSGSSGDSDDDDNGGGSSGASTGGASGSSGEGGGSGSAGRGGTSQGGSAGRGGSTSTGGAPGPGGQGGEGDSGGMTAGGAGGEGGSGAIEGATCLAIHESAPSTPSGIYTIDPAGNSGAPFQVLCDMTTDGGGWTLGFVKNSVHNGNYQDFGSSYVDVDALATSPAAASATTFTTAVAGWADLNSFPYTELRLAGYEAGAEAYTSVAIQKSTLRLAFGQNGYYLYDDANGYYWCGGENSYTTDGMGQENKPTGAPDDCKGHTSLGNGWDFSTSNSANTGLTICGGGSLLMTSRPGSNYYGYGSPGAAQAIWVR